MDRYMNGQEQTFSAIIYVSRDTVVFMAHLIYSATTNKQLQMNKQIDG